MVCEAEKIEELWNTSTKELNATCIIGQKQLDEHGEWSALSNPHN